MELHLQRKRRRMSRPEEKRSAREIAVDVVKSLLQWAFVSACSFLYWMLVLFLLSMFLLNIWHTTIEDLLRYGIILTVITSLGYAGVLIHRKIA